MPTVKKILPQSNELPLKKVATYCRVSTKAQEQLDSLVAQERYYEDKIRTNPNWKFAGIYFSARGNSDSMIAHWLSLKSLT